VKAEGDAVCGDGGSPPTLSKGGVWSLKYLGSRRGAKTACSNSSRGAVATHTVPIFGAFEGHRHFARIRAGRHPRTGSKCQHCRHCFGPRPSAARVAEWHSCSRVATSSGIITDLYGLAQARGRGDKFALQTAYTRAGVLVSVRPGPTQLNRGVQSRKPWVNLGCTRKLCCRLQALVVVRPDREHGDHARLVGAGEQRRRQGDRCAAEPPRIVGACDGELRLIFVRVRLAGCERFGWLTLIFLQIARCITRLARVASYW